MPFTFDLVWHSGISTRSQWSPAGKVLTVDGFLVVDSPSAALEAVRFVVDWRRPIPIKLLGFTLVGGVGVLSITWLGLVLLLSVFKGRYSLLRNELKTN